VEFSRVFHQCIASTLYLWPEDGDRITQYKWKNQLRTTDTWTSAYKFSMHRECPFTSFYPLPETIPMHDSDMDAIYVKETINPNCEAIPVTIEPDPNADFQDAIQSNIAIAHEVINLDGNEENEKLVLLGVLPKQR
jgi:hypothetical protein